MRTPSSPCKPVRVQPSRTTPVDTLRDLLRLEQQTLWTTRRLRGALLPVADGKRASS